MRGWGLGTQPLARHLPLSATGGASLVVRCLYVWFCFMVVAASTVPSAAIEKMWGKTASLRAWNQRKS
eukprot:12822408-Alexandrium_andersonii.AAC.1